LHHILLGFIILHFQVHLMYPEPGHVEMDPRVLWRDFTELMRQAIRGMFIVFLLGIFRRAITEKIISSYFLKNYCVYAKNNSIKLFIKLYFPRFFVTVWNGQCDGSLANQMSQLLLKCPILFSLEIREWITSTIWTIFLQIYFKIYCQVLQTTPTNIQNDEAASK
jgi:hypothetical protein